MGNHYGFVTIPCQPVRPTHKAKVENQVQVIYHRIYARLRNRQFFSLEELNSAVAEYLTRHNQTRMQQRPYTREEHFHAIEKPELRPLPRLSQLRQALLLRAVYTYREQGQDNLHFITGENIRTWRVCSHSQERPELRLYITG